MNNRNPFSGSVAGGSSSYGSYPQMGSGMGSGMSGLGSLLGGLFGDSGQAYQDAMDQYEKYGNKAEGAQNPFLQAGQGAIGDYQKWLGGMQDPSGFINQMMGQYQQSPYAKYMQDQANRAGINAGSASGLSGSTPMMQQMQQNSGNIASQDMQNWLSQVLGINTQYGQGQQNLMNQGAGAANSLTNMWGNMGNQMGQAAYGKSAGENQDLWNMINGGLQLGSSVGSMFL